MVESLLWVFNLIVSGLGVSFFDSLRLSFNADDGGSSNPNSALYFFSSSFFVCLSRSGGNDFGSVEGRLKNGS